MLLQLKGEHSHAPVACFLVSGPGLKPCCEDQRKRDGDRERRGLGDGHSPSIAFRHLPPNSARFSYATEGALDFICGQLSSDAVSALRKVRVLI